MLLDVYMFLVLLVFNEMSMLYPENSHRGRQRHLKETTCKNQSGTFLSLQQFVNRSVQFAKHVNIHRFTSLVKSHRSIDNFGVIFTLRVTLVARAIRNAIRVNRFARIIRN